MRTKLLRLDAGPHPKPRSLWLWILGHDHAQACTYWLTSLIFIFTIKEISYLLQTLRLRLLAYMDALPFSM